MSDIKQKYIKHTAEELDALANLAVHVDDAPELTTEQIDNMKQGLGVGKYVHLDAQLSMSIDTNTFSGNSIVSVGSNLSITITSVDVLDFEVVFVLLPNATISIPSGIPIIGEADNKKFRIFSFMYKTLVIGNFEWDYNIE